MWKMYCQPCTAMDLTKHENMLLCVCIKTINSKLIKLETSHMVIFPPMVSVPLLGLAVME